MIRIDAVVLTYNENEEILRQNLTSILDSRGEFALRIFLVNNFFSTRQRKKVKDVFQAFKRDFPRQAEFFLILNKENLGFAGGINAGLRKIFSLDDKGDFVLLLNPDAQLDRKALLRAVEFAQGKAGLGILGLGMSSPQGRPQPSFGRYPSLFTEFLRQTRLDRILPWGRIVFHNFLGKKYYKSGQVDWVGAGAMLVKREVFEKIGLFDENFFLYIEDIDFCRRASEAGFQIWYLPEAKVRHHQGESFRNQKCGKFFSLKGPKAWERRSLSYYFRKYPCLGRQGKTYYMYSGYWLEPAGLRKLDFVVRSIQDFSATKKLKILDLGCGKGNISFPLAALGYNVSGIDIDKATIDYLNRRKKHLGLKNLDFVQADAENPEALKKFGQFDVVIASEVLEHFKNPAETLKSLKVLLEPEGILILSVPNVLSPEEGLRMISLRTSPGRALRRFVKRKMSGKFNNNLVQARSETPHLHFWTWFSFKQLLRAEDFQPVRCAAQSAGFKSFFYVLGRLFLERSGWLFQIWNKLDESFASLVPCFLGDGIMLTAKIKTNK